MGVNNTSSNANRTAPTRSEDFECLRDTQSMAAALYGRLEIERALVWTIEELGELAQAVRRAEGEDRLEEELGQLTAWTFCLANILNLDIAKALHRAFSKEANRQMEKYGHPHPYESRS